MINQDYEEFLGLVKKAGTLYAVKDLLDWDRMVMMPKGEGQIRAQEMGVIVGLEHELLTSNRLGTLIKKLQKDSSLSADQISNLRETSREYNRRKSVPPGLVEELARTCSEAETVWENARARSDFGVLAPYLKKVVELSQKRAEFIDSKKHPYEVLLGDYEDDFTVRDIESHFNSIKSRLVPLIQRVALSPSVDNSFLERKVGRGRQIRFSRSLAKSIGYDFKKGRLDESTHPFTAGYRITTRLNEGLWGTISSTMHEAGHGMYEQNLPIEHFGTPLGKFRSISIHESQSRLWENNVGLSQGFWGHFFPKLKMAYSPVFDDVGANDFYRAINKVEPGFIRVKSDELTYPAHIFLRTELERGLIEGSLSVDDLPQKWNEKMQEYLGITPRNDAEGVLQDPHWPAGLFGYFPTYTLGTMMSAQQFNAVARNYPEFIGQMENGNLNPLRKWLKENIHQHGKRFGTKELMERATGKPPGSEDYMGYLEAKYRALY